MNDREDGYYWLMSHKGDTIGLLVESVWEIVGYAGSSTESEVLSDYMIGDKIER